MTVSSEKARKLGKKEVAWCSYGKGGGRNSIICEFCKCWLHERCIGYRATLNQFFKCPTCTSQETCTGIELDGQSLEFVKTFCYLGDTEKNKKGKQLTVL